MTTDCIRRIPIWDLEACPFCTKNLTPLVTSHAVYDEAFHYINSSLSTFWSCNICNVAFITPAMKDDLVKSLKPYRAAFTHFKITKRTTNKNELTRIMYTKIIQPESRKQAKKLKGVKLKDNNHSEELKQRIKGENEKLRLEHEKKIRYYHIDKFLSENGSPADFTRNGKSKSIKVMVNQCHCKSCKTIFGNNTIINMSARVESLNGKLVVIDVQACYRCGSYYIDYNSLLIYEEKYGRILLERYYDDEIEFWEDEHHFYYNPDTVLSRCGYRAQENDRRIDRWAVIDYILDSGKASKSELKEILSRFISRRGARCYMAVKKWQEDLEHINTYKADQQEVVEGLKLIKNPKR